MTEYRITPASGASRLLGLSCFWVPSSPASTLCGLKASCLIRSPGSHRRPQNCEGSVTLPLPLAILTFVIGHGVTMDLHLLERAHP
jgi:hypothetical protein